MQIISFCPSHVFFSRLVFHPSLHSFSEAMSSFSSRVVRLERSLHLLTLLTSKVICQDRSKKSFDSSYNYMLWDGGVSTDFPAQSLCFSYFCTLFSTRAMNCSKRARISGCSRHIFSGCHCTAATWSLPADSMPSMTPSGAISRNNKTLGYILQGLMMPRVYIGRIPQGRMEQAAFLDIYMVREE